MTIKTAGLSYLEHWRNDMIQRRRQHRQQQGNDTTLQDFMTWHKNKYGHGTHFGSWVEHEAPKLESDP